MGVFESTSDLSKILARIPSFRLGHHGKQRAHVVWYTNKEPTWFGTPTKSPRVLYTSNSNKEAYVVGTRTKISRDWYTSNSDKVAYVVGSRTKRPRFSYTDKETHVVGTFTKSPRCLVH